MSDLRRAATAMVPYDGQDGLYVRIDAELTSDTYSAAKLALERIGGRYVNRNRGFRFPPGAPVQHWLDRMRSDGEMPPDNPTAYYRSPGRLANQLVDWMMRITLHDRPGIRYLEPSAGDGSIVRVLVESTRHVQIDAVEIDPMNLHRLHDLAEQHPGRVIVHEADFLAWDPPDGVVYDGAIMNPPFSVEGDAYAWVTHIEKALSHTGREFGELLSVVPSGALFRHKPERLVDLAYRARILGELSPLPAGTFKESGTSAGTAILYLRNTDVAFFTEPYQGMATRRAHEAALTIYHNRDMLEAVSSSTSLTELKRAARRQFSNNQNRHLQIEDDDEAAAIANYLGLTFPESIPVPLSRPEASVADRCPSCGQVVASQPALFAPDCNQGTDVLY